MSVSCVGIDFSKINTAVIRKIFLAPQVGLLKNKDL